jgi:putative ABC transport system substrate-binding protein
MHRRTFMTLTGGMAANWSISAFAQSSSLPTVGFVNNGSQKAFATLLAKFRQGLGQAGFIEGQTVAIETRWADGNDERLQALISELVQRRVSVIAATGGSRSTVAAQAATTTVPVVFVMGADPVKLGLVKSLNKPGGNLTGVSLLSNGLLAKQIAILHEAIAKGATIGFLVRPTNPNADNDTRDATTASETLGHKLLVAKADTQTEIAPAIADLVQSGVAALVIFPDVLFISNIDELATLTTSHKLPAIYNFPEFAAAGGLLTYGGNQNEGYRQAGIYTGRILKGEKPSDLPVVQSSRFELIVNLKTAKAFGLNLSQTLLATVDQVIE